MFAGINIHEFLKFLHQFKLRFLTKNMEIASKLCNFLFADSSRDSFRGGSIVLRNPRCYFLQTLVVLFPTSFLLEHKKAHYIICTDSYQGDHSLLSYYHFCGATKLKVGFPGQKHCKKHKKEMLAKDLYLGLIKMFQRT